MTITQKAPSNGSDVLSARQARQTINQEAKAKRRETVHATAMDLLAGRHHEKSIEIRFRAELNTIELDRLSKLTPGNGVIPNTPVQRARFAATKIASRFKPKAMMPGTPDIAH